MAPRAILFDLDGTLVQTREASWKLFTKTNAAFALGIDTQDAFFRLLEDNLFQALRKHCGDERKAEEAARHFLGLLQSDYHPVFVPGMSDVVRAFAGNCALAVLSSNAIAAIRRILTEAGIAHCFSHVFGGDVEQDKRSSVRRFLADRSYLVNRQCSPAYREDDQPPEPSADQIVLITDTVGDVRHARECGIRAVGVAWGMHTEAQLNAAGAEFVALWPQELIAHLLPGGFAAAVCGVGAPASAPAAAGPENEQNELRHASQMRRHRALVAAARRDAQTCACQQHPQQPGGNSHQPRAAKADATLLNSLARLRGLHRSPASEALKPT
ncbi:MAG: HAD hydrolase-like protein [Gammaproteobacteria bacterium]